MSKYEYVPLKAEDFEEPARTAFKEWQERMANLSPIEKLVHDHLLRKAERYFFGDID